MKNLLAKLAVASEVLTSARNPLWVIMAVISIVADFDLLLSLLVSNKAI